MRGLGSHFFWKWMISEWITELKKWRWMFLFWKSDQSGGSTQPDGKLVLAVSILIAPINVMNLLCAWFLFCCHPLSDGWSPGGSDRLTPSHGTHSKPRRPAEHAHSSNLVGSGYLLCLNYTARKSSRSPCVGEGVVIDQVLPGDFEIRLMVIVREGRNANEIVVIAADVMQNIKAQS